MALFSPDHPDKWTEDFTTVITGLAEALAGHQLTPELLKSTSAIYAHALCDHELVVPHSPKGVCNKRTAYFHIAVFGKRLDARWNVTPGVLVQLCAAALRHAAQPKDGNPN